MTRLKSIVKGNKMLFKLANTARLFLSCSVVRIDGSKKKYPKVIQLPITYLCNSRCVMCNIWNMDHTNEMNVPEFAGFLADPIFIKVETVGINGGEPSLLPNLAEYVQEVLKLPALKAFNIISHGFSSSLLLQRIEEIYQQCRQKGVRFHLSISLDGVGDIHDTVRGRSKVFDRTIATIENIVKDTHRYCDSFDIGCTVVQQNIYHLMELDVYAKIHNLPVKYRLGIDNKRIQSDKLSESFSVINKPWRQSAKEFFFYQASQAKTIQDKFKYFSIFYWLNSATPERLLGCIWKDEGVTMDSRGDLYYCAVASEKIGSLREETGESIFFSDKNIDYRKNIIQMNCDNCIHDYSGKPELKNLLLFLKVYLQRKLAMNFYKYRCRFGII